MSSRQAIKKLIPKKVFQQIEPFGHKLEAIVAASRKGMPAKKLNVIGVTGTNGKTTTAFMIHRMLTEAGYKVGLLTTVANGIGNDITPQVEHMTTVSAPLLNKRLKEFQEQDVDWVVLETTSHALAQNRVWGVPYQIAVMTNITHEHLDYHGSFEKYLVAKRRMFEVAAKHPNGFGVVNADDPNAKRFTEALPNNLTYGLENGELQAVEVKLESDGSKYKARIGEDAYSIRCNIPGEFNVSNSLAAVAVGRHIGLSKSR